MSGQILRQVKELHRNEVTLAERNFLSVIGDAQNNCDRPAWLSHETIAVRAGFTRRTSYRCVGPLVEKQLLEVTRSPGRRGGRSKVNGYRVLAGDRKVDTVLSRDSRSPSLGSASDDQHSERTLALARQVAELSNYTLDLTPKQLATVSSWCDLDELVTDELVIRVVRADRVRPNAPLVYSLNFYTNSIKLELLRLKAGADREGKATLPAPITSAAIISATSVPVAAVPTLVAQPAPSAVRLESSELCVTELAVKAMGWAKIRSRPNLKELGLVKRWLDAGADPDLIRSDRARARPA